MNESVIAHEADLSARDAIALMADRISARGSFLRALLIYALDCARTGTPASADGLAMMFGMRRKTLTSRSWRNRVDIKGILNRVRLIRAAAVLELPDVSVGMASLILGASSEQAFSRTIYCLTNLTPPQWRAAVNSRRELADLERYLLRHSANLDAMPPLSMPAVDPALREAAS